MNLASILPEVILTISALLLMVVELGLLSTLFPDQDC